MRHRIRNQISRRRDITFLPASSGDKSFQNLMEYGYGVNNAGSNRDTGILVGPLSFLRSGNYNTDGNISNRGSYGSAWSSLSNGGTNVYYLRFNSSNLNYQNSYSRGYGRPVRCVEWFWAKIITFVVK